MSEKCSTHCCQHNQLLRQPYTGACICVCVYVGTGDTVAVMITEALGKDLLSFLEKNETVWVTVSVGFRGPVKHLNRGSLVFVSISFIVLMIISSAWLIFYFIQKIRDTNARDRSQVTHTYTQYQAQPNKFEAIGKILGCTTLHHPLLVYIYSLSRTWIALSQAFFYLNNK